MPNPTWREVRVPHAAKVVFASCVLAFGVILWGTRTFDFYQDEWSFLDTAAHWRPSDYFAPHNEHWSTLPMLVYKVLLSIDGAHSHVPFMAALLVVHVCAVFLLFLVIRRRCGDLLALCSAVILLFLGRGSDDLIWAFQIGFVGSVAFGLLALHLLGDPATTGRRRAAGASVALLLALMSSGIGLFFLIVTGVYLAFDRERRRLLWVLIGPGAAYVLWYFTFGYQGVSADRSPLHLATIEGLVGYTPTGIGAASAGVFGLSPLWGPIGFAAFAATAALLWYRKRTDSGLAIAATVGIVLQFTMTGLVRVQYGSVQATTSRYVYIGAVFVLLVLTEAVRDVPWAGIWKVVAPVTAACVVALGGSALLQAENLRTHLLATQKHELEITWLFRDAPGLDHNVAIDPQLLPIVSPAAYFASRAAYGSALPVLTLAQLYRLKPRFVNDQMRTLMPLLVTNAPGSVPPSACRLMLPAGGQADLSEPGGSAADVESVGLHTSNQVELSTWFMGNAPDGRMQRWIAAAGRTLRVKFADTGLHLNWHFRIKNDGGSQVAVCLGNPQH